MNEEEIDKNEIAKEFELIFKGNQAILCISSEFNEDPKTFDIVYDRKSYPYPELMETICEKIS